MAINKTIFPSLDGKEVNQRLNAMKIEEDGTILFDGERVYKESDIVKGSIESTFVKDEKGELILDASEIIKEEVI